jgi:hypothetical protein
MMTIYCSFRNKQSLAEYTFPRYSYLGLFPCSLWSVCVRERETEGGCGGLWGNHTTTSASTSATTSASVIKKQTNTKRFTNDHEPSNIVCCPPVVATKHFITKKIQNKKFYNLILLFDKSVISSYIFFIEQMACAIIADPY